MSVTGLGVTTTVEVTVAVVVVLTLIVDIVGTVEVKEKVVRLGVFAISA